jgi:hypothetical protein
MLLALLLAISITPPVFAGKVVLRISAGNPIEKEQPVSIKSDLPIGVRTNDIISLGGLELGYDVKNDTYFVHRELLLSAKQIVQFNVEINDIWTLPDTRLRDLNAHADGLLAKLDGDDTYETAERLHKNIRELLKNISDSQSDNALSRPGIKPIQHIRAHESNMETLQRVRMDLGRLENLVLGTGRDTGGMLGHDARTPKPERYKISPEQMTSRAIIRYTVQNTSQRYTRKIPLKRYLPPEIREHDVLDLGGLDMSTDQDRGQAYVFKDEVEVSPGETITFEVTIRDKWNINEPRIEGLLITARDTRIRVAARDMFDSVEAALVDIINGLEQIAAITGPEIVDERYVAFYRGQANDLDALETRLNRIIMALPQIERTTKIGFKVKPPSPKTTWLIIYIIIGFLMAMSVVFFFRWYGRTKAEKAEEADPGE